MSAQRSTLPLSSLGGFGLTAGPLLLLPGFASDPIVLGTVGLLAADGQQTIGIAATGLLTIGLGNVGLRLLAARTTSDDTVAAPEPLGASR